MSRAPAGRDAERIAEQLPRRRRRLGLALVALAVLAIAAQSLFEWLLPYDLAALAALRQWSGRPTLAPAEAVAVWAAACLVLLLLLERARGARPLGTAALAALAGLALGSAQLAAGGSAASLALLLVLAVATLGWQGRREGGLVLLLATAAAIAGWDAAMSDFPSLWLPVLVLVGVFQWIDHMHIRANDRRLFGALAEREELIASLDQRTAELTTLQGARTQLLASISHDLRQPLQAVRLFAEALLAPDEGGSPLGPRRRELLRQQMRAADDAVAMLDQFSEFSAIEQGALQSRPEPVELRDLLDGVAAGLQAAHPRETLRIHVHGRRHWVSTDRTQLARLVQNLAGNAVRYSVGARPGVPARVVLAVRPHAQGGGPAEGAAVDAGLCIDVVDNGRGIPADKLEAIFEPYVQLGAGAAGASRSGRGLGLAIVRGLASQLGFGLQPVRSRLGHGTRFRVRVPQRHRLAAPGADAPAAAPAAPDIARLDGWLLALLDDEPAARAAMRAALEGAGATIVEAGSLEQLKVRLDDEPRFPDALVFDLDLGSGKADGLDAVDQLRAEWELPVPAVIVTGRVAAMGSVPLPKQCVLLGKPVSLELLVATLRRVARREAG